MSAEIRVIGRKTAFSAAFVAAKTVSTRPACQRTDITGRLGEPRQRNQKEVMEKIRITAVEKTISNSIIETFETMLSMELSKVGLSSDPGMNERRLVGSVNYGIRPADHLHHAGHPRGSDRRVG
jgi:hypothetical protein